MTAAAIDYRADRVMIAADSAAYADDAVHIGHGVCKLHVLPIARSVLFSRGKISIHTAAVMRLSQEPRIRNFEDCAEAVGPCLTAAADHWCKVNDHQWAEGEIWAEAILCGWSETEERMRLAGFTSRDSLKPHTENDRMYGGPIPWPPLPAAYVPPDRAADSAEKKLCATLRAIDQWAADHAEEFNGVRLGGDIMCVTITEDKITTSVIGTFNARKGKR